MTRTCVAARASNGCGHGGSEPLGDRPLGSVGVLDQDGELVAAEPGHGVARRAQAQESLGDGDEQPVALRVAQAVVHVLEVVQVQKRTATGAPRR